MSVYSNDKPSGNEPAIRRWFSTGIACLTFLLLSGCDQLGIDTPATIQARAEQEGKAVGTACRHAMRAIEDCYAMNAKTPKSAIATGWREMDEYMRENNIAGVAPELNKAGAMDKKEPADEEAPAESASAAH